MKAWAVINKDGDIQLDTIRVYEDDSIEHCEMKWWS